MDQKYHRFILEIKKRQNTIKSADYTYFAFVVNQKSTNLQNQKIELTNKMFKQSFSNSILGNHERSSQTKLEDKFKEFEQYSVDTARLYIKEFQNQGKLVRLIYFPIQKYQLDILNIQESYNKMINQFFLLNMFLHHKCTKKIKVFVMARAVKVQQIYLDDSQLFDFEKCKKNALQVAKNEFCLQSKQIQSKLTFLLIACARKDKISITQSITYEDVVFNQTFIYTKDSNPLYKLEKLNQSWTLNTCDISQILNNNVISISNFHKLFHYKRFVKLNVECRRQFADSQKQKIIKYKRELQPKIKLLDMSVVQDMWGPIQTILKPMFNVRENISQKFGLKLNLDYKVWPNKPQESYDLYKFNTSYCSEQWVPKLQVNDAQKQKAIRPNPSQQVLDRFTSYFNNIYGRFLHQDENLIHAMILDYINQIQKQIFLVKQKILNAPSKLESVWFQKQVLYFCKIVVRLLGSLKPHALFKQVLHNYEPQLYEHLLDVFLQSYEEFSIAYQINFGRISNLCVKFESLKTDKKDLLSAIMQARDMKQLFQDGSRITASSLLKKQQLLKIFLRLLTENQPEQKDKKYDIKVYRAIYDLSSTLYKTALQPESSELNQQKDFGRQKQALRLLFDELYLPIFTIQKNLLQYKESMNFTQQQLLQKMSGILRILEHMGLSIELQKKLGFVSNVEKYYNYWLTFYQRFDPEINKILQQAIKYFSIKFETQIVQTYYNLLIRNSKTTQQKKVFELRKYDYLESFGNQASRKKLINKARDAVFDLSKDTIKKIRSAFVTMKNE